MVTLQEMISFFEQIAPPYLAEDYDNVGLLIEGNSQEIYKIVLALDVDEHVVLQAETMGAELIVCHHPLLFKPIRSLTMATGQERTIRRLIQKGIGLYALHTNFDGAEDGLCDVFLDCFGSFVHRCSFSGTQAGIGRIGRLEYPCTLESILKQTTETLHIPHISYVGDVNQTIETIAVCNGGGGDLLYEAYGLGAQLYVSGDFKHHHARFAKENQMALINISHFDAEIGFSSLMQQKLTSQFGQRLQLMCAEEQNPWQRY
ncbi:MAG: Nif3-like dinuclear metal center hexameric protein [Ruminococcaceae bacterium]|nr:Nif3-like dinuclear metal center hexameric protein [Oscillospiraceae bacterium]